MVFYSAVFPGMKTQDRDSTTGAKAGWDLRKKRIERTEFIIHSNADRLEGSRNGRAARLVINSIGKD